MSPFSAVAPCGALIRDGRTSRPGAAHLTYTIRPLRRQIVLATDAEPLLVDPAIRYVVGTLGTAEPGNRGCRGENVKNHDAIDPLGDEVCYNCDTGRGGSVSGSTQMGNIG